MAYLTPLIVAVLLLCTSVHPKRILFITPTPSLSHNLFYRPIIRELSLRGHDVLSITVDPINDPKLSNLTEIDLHDWGYNVMDVEEILKKFHTTSPMKIFRIFGQYTVQMCDEFLSQQPVQEIIANKDEHFDLVILEIMSYMSFQGFGARFNAPVIGVTSFPGFVTLFDALGNPSNPAYFTDTTKTSGYLDFWQRLDNFWYVWDFRYWWNLEYAPEQNKIMQKYFGNGLDVRELEKKVDLVLANWNPIFHVPRPLAQTYIPIGGMHKRDRQPVPKNLKTFLDESKQGFIYMSLGSNIKSKNLPTATREAIITAFKSLPFNVLWKFENTSLENKPQNVFIEKWVPQQEVLDHPNIKAFITQGGLQSLDEAITAKVPIIGIPVGGDQPYNIDRVVQLEIGKQLHLTTITSESLKGAIIEVATNSKYKKNISKIGVLLHDQETHPLDRALWWIEYVLRHGGAQHLRSPGADLPWYKYLLLDVLGFLVACGMAAILAAYFLFRIIVSFIFRLRKNKVD